MNTVEKPMYRWTKLPWKKFEGQVFKLQKRIYRASQEGDNKTVHKLQRLLLSSWAARCMAVRRVTQDNKGKRTPGVDGVSNLNHIQRLELAESLSSSPSIPDPVRRVFIDKANGEKRPLGIPTIRDRAVQSLVKLALEPQWEARFEPGSYGFRPGRSAHDAIEAIFTATRYMPKYVLDADIKGCFDNIDHQTLLNKLDTIPKIRRLVKGWLKAGIMEGEVFQRTDRGTPQGGVILPLLANIALHGLEEAITKLFPKNKRVNGQTTPWSPRVVRYADDFVILHRDEGVIDKCREQTKAWLRGIGLELSKEKTRIAHTTEGFDFLGFNVRHHKVGKTHRVKTGGRTKHKSEFKIVIRPSKAAVERHYRKIALAIGQSNAQDQGTLIRKLNPIIRGWANYFSTAISTETFRRLDHLIVQRLLRWGRRRHNKKSRSWIVQKYFDPEKTKECRPWDFANGKGDVLFRHEDVKIVRHTKVAGTRSPFDGDWAYWCRRMGKHPLVGTRMRKLLKNQQGKCTICGMFFKPDDLLEVDRIKPGREGGRYTHSNMQLLHRHCHLQKSREDFKRWRSAHSKGCIKEEPCELETLTHGSEEQF